MHIGYIIAIILTAVWLVFKIIEVVKARKEQKQVETVFVKNDENTL